MLWDKVLVQPCRPDPFHVRWGKSPIAAYEILTITEPIQELITNNSSDEVIERLAVREGMDLMVFSGIKKTREGTTTLEEVMRVLVTERSGFFCPSCRQPVALGADRCPACGAEIHPTAPTTVPLPATRVRQPQPSPTQPLPIQPPTPEQGERPRILVAGDDGETRRFLAPILRSEGFDVVEAADGEQAIERTFRREPDLVILDAVMPKMDGYEVCRRLRSRLSTGCLPVIMLAAKDDLESELQGIGAGADDYITKPFEPARVVSHCKMLLSRDLTASRLMRRVGEQREVPEQVPAEEISTTPVPDEVPARSQPPSIQLPTPEQVLAQVDSATPVAEQEPAKVVSAAPVSHPPSPSKREGGILAECAHHPGIAAVGRCGRCGNSFCAQCLTLTEPDGSRYCNKCAFKSAVETSVEDQAEKEAEQRERGAARESREQKRERRRKVILLTGIGACLLIIAFQLSPFSPRGIGGLRQRPARFGPMATDSKTDQCLNNLWEIARMLQEGEELDPSLKCPASGKPYKVSFERGKIIVRCPTPGRHGVSELLVSKDPPIPEVMP
jgi:CheY-like chemotaxis protein